MNRTKIITILITFVLIMSFVTGCSGKSKNSDTAATNKTNGTTSTNKDGTTNITGKVTAIDGKKITITEFPGNRMHDGREGGPGGLGGNENIPSGNPDDMGKRPQGDRDQRPDRDDSSNNVPKMESKVITISDESIISIQDGDTITSGSLKDITKDSFLQITYKKDKNGKEVLSSVVVSTLQRRDRNNINNDVQK